MTVEAIILAAGEGARMRSALPKSLHTVGGRAMLEHIIDAVNSLRPEAGEVGKIHVVIDGRNDCERGGQVKAAIERALSDSGQQPLLDKINWVTQPEPLGTGHAVMQAMPVVGSTAMVLLLYGDTPLISPATLESLLTAGNQTNHLALLTATPSNPAGLGRIVRDAQGKVIRIVEEKDANDEQKQIRECNAGFIAAPAAVIQSGLATLGNDNAQQEYYLTDLIANASAAGVEIVACQPAAIEETFGVNSQADLARVERIYQANQARRLLEQGVCLRDPSRFDLRGRCQFGRDCVVDVNVILEGEVVVGDGCRIGANAVIRNSRIGAGSVIETNCIIEQAVIGARCQIGPFARLRPQAELADEVHIGNFVEVKKSHIGRGSKANHLSYLGDSTLGEGVNIGAGVITCNYDGANKHRTRIGDDVFVGSNSQLVAPLAIGDGATIGAGSTITQDVAAQALAVGRARQKTIRNWKRPSKQRSGK